MKNLLFTFLLTFLCLQAAAKTAEFNWKLQEKSPYIILTAVGDSATVIPGQFRVYNGKTKKFEKLSASSGKNNLTLSNSAMRLTVAPEKRGEVLLFNFSLTNNSKQEMFLQPEIVLFVSKSGNTSFFNGYENIDANKLPIRRDGLKGRPQQKLGGILQVFPAAGVIGEKITVFAGQPPHDLISYHAAHLENAGNKYRFIFNQRHAVAAGQTVKFRMYIGLTATCYGKETAMIQRIFNSFPEDYAPVVSKDNPYIWGTEQYMESWSKIPDYELERRYRASLTWAFVPFKRAGDIYGHKELWDYTPFRPFKLWYNSKIAGKRFDFRSISQEQFHRQRDEIFHNYAKDFGYAFYNSASGVWCEDQLAVSKYPDSIVDDTDKVQKYITPWITPWDKHVRVFSYRTSFGKKFREDMKKIYSRLGMPGFAFDCVTPGAYYRGPAAKDPDMPGRAWDEKGVFVDQIVALIKMADFVHQELPGAFVWLNGTTGHGDSVMLEYGIFEDSFRGAMPVARYNAGQLPMQTRGYGYARFLFDYLPDWRNMSRKEFLDEIEKLSIHLIFNYFHYGLTGTYNTANGSQMEQYIMPELLELRKLGWQAQAPVSVNTDKLFYRSRYGQGENSVIFMGNPWQESVNCKAEIGNRILGDANYLWIKKMRDRAETVNMVKGNKSSFDLQLTSRIPILYESVCGLSSTPEKGVAVKVSAEKDIDKIIYRLHFSGNPEFSTALYPRQIEGFTLVGITLNGSAVKAEKVTVPRNGQIVLEYRSNQFAFNRKSMMSFPFTDQAGKVVLAIQLPENANASELRQAKRLKGIFDFLVKRKVIPGAEISVIQGKNTGNISSIAVSVGRNTGKAQAALSGKCWQISAPDSASADRLVREFSYIIDQRFEYFFPFAPRGWDAIHPDILAYFNLDQERLPLTRCFESNGVKK